MAQHAQDLASHGVDVFAVGFDDLQALRDVKSRLDSPFTFLRDRSRAGYRAMDLGRAGVARTYLHPDVLRPYARLALQGRFPRLRKHQDRRQLGGDFVVLRNGRVVFCHPEQGPEDRAPVGAIVKAAEDAAGS